MKKSLYLPSFKFKHTITVSHCVCSLHDLGPNFQTKIFKPTFLTPKFGEKNSRAIICFSHSAFPCCEIPVMEAEQTGQLWAPALAAEQRSTEEGVVPFLGGIKLLGLAPARGEGWDCEEPQLNLLEFRYCLNGAALPPQSPRLLRLQQGPGRERARGLSGAALSRAQPAQESRSSVLCGWCIIKHGSRIFRSSAAVLKQVPCWENKYQKCD